MSDVLSRVEWELRIGKSWGVVWTQMLVGEYRESGGWWLVGVGGRREGGRCLPRSTRTMSRAIAHTSTVPDMAVIVSSMIKIAFRELPGGKESRPVQPAISTEAAAFELRLEPRRSVSARNTSNATITLQFDSKAEERVAGYGIGVRECVQKEKPGS